MDKKENNFAFIDSQNVNMGVEELGWKLDFRKFITYLREKYSVKTAYLFIGYLPENQRLYANLQKYGYVLIFKPVMKDNDGKPKGNVDADLVLQVMIDFDKYDKTVMVSSDGDFYSLVEYLYTKNKLKVVLSPNKEKCSILLRKKAKEKIDFIDNLKNKLEYIKK
ncbi:MAG: NYN domain-containing protein [Candidatus Pacebacteria bacterium]|nr:NYN domain-containing protein [Candidatus Paceibacterota bacterium]